MVPDDLVPRVEPMLSEVRGALSRLLADSPAEAVSRRQVVRTMGKVGLLSQLVPAPPSLTDVLTNSEAAREPVPVSSRVLCFVRESLAYDALLWDQAFALQGLASEVIVLASSLRVGSKAALSARATDALAAISSGQAVATFALMEAASGLDASQLTTHAEPSGEGYVISGTKEYVPGALDADWFVVFAAVVDNGERRASAFLVPAGDSLRREPVDLLGGHPMGTVHFERTVVPKDHLLGEVGDGVFLARKALCRYQTTAGAAACGIAARAFDETLHHVRRRQQFGMAVPDAPMLHAQLANMAREYEAARLMVYRSAATFDEALHGGKMHAVRSEARVRYEASLAKWTATEAAQRVVDWAVQCCGPQGVEQSSVVGQLYDEVRAMRVFDGHNELHQDTVAKELLEAE